jgi:AraC-like DNA-binding protein
VATSLNVPPSLEPGASPRWNDAPPFAPDVLAVDVSDERYPLERLFADVRCVVHRAAWVPCWPGWSQPEFVKPWYLLYLCVAGGADYVVGGAAYRIDPGELLLLPPNVPRAGRHDPRNPFHLYAVHFSARIYGVLDLPATYRLPIWCRPAPDRMARMVGIAREMVRELALGEPGCLLAAGGQCAALLALLVREHVTTRPSRTPSAAEATGAARDPWNPKNPGGPQSREAERMGSRVPAGTAAGAALDRRESRAVEALAPVFRLIERDHAERLTLPQLASTVHLHPAYFSALFRRVTGLSPTQYVAQYRLNRVRELLLSTDLPVSDVAAMAGFHDLSYLGRAFRKVEGISPTEYRRAKASPNPP